MSSIKIENISKSFDGKEILKGIDLDIKDGEFISLLGPSGCGKTTTLRTVAGLIEPDEGDILIDGSSILDQAVEKREAVIVFQDYRLFPHLNVRENIGFGLKMAREKKSIIKEKVDRMLELVQLEEYGGRYPNELSGGQQQRVALARALAISPKVLLLDEPFSNLDMKLREEMRDFTLSIQKELNITTILVTHDKEEAFIMSDRVALMLDGEIKQFDSAKNIYERPRSRSVADFIGKKNYISGVVEDNIFKSRILETAVDIEDSGLVYCMIRPENISLRNSGELLGEVVRKKYGGDRIYYDVKVSGLILSAQLESLYDYNVGDKVYLHFRKDKLIFYKE